MKNYYPLPQLTTIFRKTLAVATASSILLQALYPANALASVTGPSQPEFSSFQSVGTDGLINTFTGDFSYGLPVLQIPGSDGGGYALSLSYNSSVGVEEEASWVGYGWTLNAGAIIRNKQGFADDVNQGTVTHYNKMKKNWTLAAGTSGSLSVRAFGIIGASIGLTNILQYNNYKGLSSSSIPYAGYQVGCKTTTFSLVDANEVRKSYSYGSPMSVMVGMASSMFSMMSSSIGQQYGIGKEVMGAISLGGSHTNSMLSGQSISSSQSAAYSLHNKSIPTPSAEYASSASYRVSLGGYAAPTPLPIGAGASVFGTYNYQTTHDESDSKYCGYLYSHNAIDTENEDGNGLENDVMMDYHVERPDNFNPHDEILSTPFATPDMFNVVGEGLSGVMRLYSSNIGEFHPKAVTNTSDDINEVGVHVNAGLNISGSVSTCEGTYMLAIDKWDDGGENSEYAFSNEGNEAYFFRFLGDMGGKVSMSSSDWSEDASMSGNNDAGYEPVLSNSSFKSDMNDGDVVGRSSHVGYHTNGDMAETDGTHYYKRYSQRDDIAALVTASNDDGIGEFAITNKQGNKYVYALPIYAKEEYNVSVDVTEADKDGNYLAYRDISVEDDIETRLGQHISSKYASMYLLTEILSSNYIDVNGNGPDNEDIGGWTKFNYTKKYGDNGTNTDSYFKWRAPWKGLVYNPRQTSNPDDDLGTYSSGEKEICYLESIETSTHIAIFETSVRKDGYEAETKEDAAKGTAIDISSGNKKLEKLDKITLYAKDSNGNAGEVISTVNFKYDYSLQLGQPNNINSYSGTTYSSTNSNSGKLTLTKVWFEYGGVLNAEVSPYEFIYEYPKTTGADAIDYPTKYKYTYEYDETDSDSDGSTLDNILTESSDEYAEFENYGSGLEENPSYNEANMDAWGNYRSDGQTRLGDMENWVDQTPATNFDPAAYKLKRIKLPTEAEIHVQYEQDQYSFVQDRRASAMVSLSAIGQYNYVDNEWIPGEPGGDGRFGYYYYLNLDDIDADNDSDKEAIVNWIQKIYIDGYGNRDPEKMYFKFNYDILECDYEFISGYANVMKVGIVPESAAGFSGGSDIVGKIYVQLGNPGTLEEVDETEVGFSSPCDACQEYFKANKGLDIGQDCGEAAMTGSDDADVAESLVLQIIDILANTPSDRSSDACQTMDVATSYLRIPVPAQKKGGGLRVKRLLRYDKGLEIDHEDAALYGTEFTYETIDGECSGVAANEPDGIREENALVTYLKKRSELTDEEVLVAGEDKSQFEGPLGESVLPGSSVGYSRVISRNIHSGSTNNGFSTAEYYTSQDYPFDRVSSDGYSGVSYTDMDKNIDNPDPTFGFFTNKTYYACWATQGFKFVINNMNGQPKKMTHYEGDYTQMNDINEVTELSSTSYQYYQPGELLPIMYSHYNFSAEGEGLPLGKEVEVVTESRAIEERSTSFTTTVDAGVMVWGVYTIPYAFPTFFSTKDESEFYTHVTNKIIYAPSTVKSVTNYKDGIYTTLTNKYFDPLTGDPVVQERSGLFDQQVLAGSTAHEGKYISFNYMASSYYGDMGQKAGCENITIGWDGSDVEVQASIAVGEGTSYDFSAYSYVQLKGDNYCNELDKLTPGDLIAVHSTTATYPCIVQIESIEGDVINVIENSNFPWSEFTSGYGNCSIEILQSNRANLLSVGAGNTVMYGEFEEPDGLYDSDQDNLAALTDYLTDLANSVSATQPDELEHISVINPNTGNCVQCEASAESESTANTAIGVRNDLAGILDDILGAGNYDITDYQDVVGWAVENDMQYEFLFEFMNEMEGYMDMAATDNCIICDNKEEYFDDGALYNVLLTSYSEWEQDYYFNATGIGSYLDNNISNESLFSSSFVSSSSFYSRLRNTNTIFSNNLSITH